MAKQGPERTEVHVDVEGRTLRLTSLEKVLYPSTGTTKGEVLTYYVTHADQILPETARLGPVHLAVTGLLPLPVAAVFGLAPMERVATSYAASLSHDLMYGNSRSPYPNCLTSFLSF
mgnify:CR=1 FL=1